MVIIIFHAIRFWFISYERIPDGYFEGEFSEQVSD